MTSTMIQGHEFSVAVSDVRPAGMLANDVDGYEAQVSIYRDGKYLGNALWEPEGFAGGGPDLLPNTDASEDCYAALRAPVREALKAWQAEREWEMSYPVAAGYCAE